MRLVLDTITTTVYQFIIDIGLFTNWINAFAADNQVLAEFYENRFRPEFSVAFDAWVASDPKNNPDAPKSPFSMPEYTVSAAQEADRLEQEASKTFEEGIDECLTALERKLKKKKEKQRSFI